DFILNHAIKCRPGRAILRAYRVSVEKDRAVLMRANPESGSFSMVSLSRRKRDRDQHHEEA
ncbi:MAG: hypothetical protein WCQ57_08665, partial [Verrucomicrobiota bacterium]